MPKVSNLDQAYIDPRKFTHYLLLRAHPKGGPKAVFFESAGFSR